jgi:purine-cytosine permease-like protein
MNAPLPAHPPASQPPQPYYPRALPTTPVLAKQTYSAPLSFIGITRRTTAWLRKVSRSTSSNTGLHLAAMIFAVVIALSFLLVMYAFITFWYVIMYGLFGVFFFPFRLLRRGHRKQEALQRQQLATMQAIYANQVAAQQAAHYEQR